MLKQEMQGQTMNYVFVLFFWSFSSSISQSPAPPLRSLVPPAGWETMYKDKQSLNWIDTLNIKFISKIKFQNVSHKMLCGCQEHKVWSLLSVAPFKTLF